MEGYTVENSTRKIIAYKNYMYIRIKDSLIVLIAKSY